MGKVKRTLSILLSVAMVVTCVPQAGLTAKAANETPDAIENVDAQAKTPDIVEDESLTDEDIDVEEEGGEAEKNQDAVADDEEIDVPEEDEVDVPAGEETEGESVKEVPADIMADVMVDESYTVTIQGYSTLKDQVTVSAEVVTGTGEDAKTETATIADAGTFSVAKDAKVSLTLTAKDGWKIKSVKNGTSEITAAGGKYTIDSVSANVTIAVETAAIYTIKVNNDAASGVTVALDGVTGDGDLTNEAGLTVEKGETAADVKFTVSGYTTNNDKLNVSYVVDEDEEGTEISADADKKYTIPANVISAAKVVTIVLKIEEQQAVTFAPNDKVKVQLWGKKDGKDDWVDANDTSAPKGAFKGEKFKFKAVGVAPYKVSKIIVNEKAIDLATNGEYEIEINGKTDITFETEVDPAESVPLTFTINGDKGSATAKITAVTPGGQDAEETNDADEIADFLCLESADLEAGVAVNVPKTIAALTVEVEPANGYELPKADDGSAAKTIYKFAPTASGDVAAIGKEMTVNVKTQIKALADGATVYFAPSENDDHLSDLKVKTGEGTKVEVATEASENTPAIYKVNGGATTVELTVKADEGYKLAEFTGDAKNLIKSVEPGDADEDGSVVYTVTLFASKITGAGAASATTLTLVSKPITFKVTVESEDSDNFTVTGTSDGSTIAYGAELNATITAEAGCSLDSVSYTMGDDEAKEVSVVDNTATVSIAKVTGNVTITVESGKVYSLTDLTDAGGLKVEKEDGVYPVSYNGAYLVGVKYGTEDVPANKITAVIKDAEGNTVELTPTSAAEGTRLKIDLAPKANEIKGQDITIDISVKAGDETISVGTYVLSVNKKTTEIKIKDADGNEITEVELTVGTRAEYKIDTDGTLIEGEDGVEKDDAAGLIKYAWIWNGKLGITMDANSSTDIAGKTATITVKAADNETVKATVTVKAKAIFEKAKAPTVTKVDNAAANKVFHVDVATGELGDVQDPEIGSLWYEVTATAKAGTDGKELPSELQSKVIKYVERTGNSQRVKLVVGNGDDETLGAGTEWSYDVTAKLIYFDEEDNDSNDVETSAVSAAAECGTVDPLFTTALKLKKGKDKVALYTGRWTDSVIATIDWNKKDTDAKFYKVADEDIQDDKSGLSFAVRGNDIVVTSVAGNAELGKHTITVYATADQTTGHAMYASRATIAVTVVKGINNIIVTTPSTSIYKPEGTNKAATLKLGVDYNHRYLGEPDNEYAAYASWDGKKYVTTPKSKKVTWEIVGADSSMWGISPAPEKIAAGVKVKNGTITVDKRFQVDKVRQSNNRFKVLVTAADYAGNETYALSDEIVITNDAVDISKLIIVNYNDDGEYEVKAVHDGIKNKQAVEISASDADGGYVFAMPATATVKKGDTFEYLSEVESKLPVVNNVTFASGNKKVLAIGRNDENDIDGCITVNVAGKKTAVKVSTADGSNNKQTHTMNLTLDYKETKGSDLALGIKVETDNTQFEDEWSWYSATNVFIPDDNVNAGNVAKANTANVKEKPITADFTTTGAARLYVKLYVGNKADATSTSYSNDDVWSTNYKLAVKGGKFVTNANGTATIITTAKETTLTLTDLSPEAKKAKKAPYVYKLTNTTYAIEAKAPKVTVKNSLHQWGKPADQEVGMTVLDPATKKPYEAGKFVKVEMDWSARTDKNKDSLDTFAGALESNLVTLDADGNTKLELAANKWGWASDLTPGSYKLKVTVGTVTKDVDQNNVFKEETLPATVTVKVVKAKVATYKLNSTYTIGELDGAVTLTGKSNLNAKAGEKMETEFYSLKNANIDGKVNDFTKYFAIDKDETSGTWRLVMTKDLKDELAKDNATMESVLGKKGLTGYITFKAEPNVSYYDTSNKNQVDVKITVKPAKPGKTGSAYKSSSAEVGTTDKGNKTRIDIVVNGEKVNVKYAAIDAAKASNEFEIDGATGAKNGQVALKVKAGAEIKAGKSYTANLKVVPADSFYASKIDDAVAAAAQTPSTQDGETTPETPASASVDDLIQQYGIAVKVSVKASESYTNPSEGTEEPENPEIPDDPNPSDEKTLAGVATELAEVAVTEWKNEKDGEQVQVKVTYDTNDDSIKDADATVASLVTAVNEKIGKMGNDYAGFIVEPKSGESFKLSNDKKTAEIKMTLKKGDDTTEVIIKVAAEEATDGGDQGGGDQGGGDQGGGDQGGGDQSV